MYFVHNLHNIPLYIFYLFFNWRIIALQNCIKFFFNWRISALQCRVHFCCTTTWISFTGTYIPSLLNLPLTLPPSYPSRSSQSARLGSLCNIAASHEVSESVVSFGSYKMVFLNSTIWFMFFFFFNTAIYKENSQCNKVKISSLKSK